MQLKWFSTVRFKPTGTKLLLLLSEENYYIAVDDDDVQDIPLPSCAIPVDSGTYQHYNSGKFYVVVGLAYMFSSEFTGWCVVYHPASEATYWAQPPETFTEIVQTKSGMMIPRFTPYPRKS